jgi:hypothetical protein
MEKEHIHKEQDPWIEELLPEEEGWRYTQFTIHAKGSDVLSLIKQLVTQANIFKVTVWHRDRALATIPIVYGSVMIALFPFLSLFTVISLLALDCKVVAHKKTMKH